MFCDLTLVTFSSTQNGKWKWDTVNWQESGRALQFQTSQQNQSKPLELSQILVRGHGGKQKRPVLVSNQCTEKPYKAAAKIKLAIKIKASHFCHHLIKSDTCYTCFFCWQWMEWTHFTSHRISWCVTGKVRESWHLWPPVLMRKLQTKGLFWQTDISDRDVSEDGLCRRASSLRSPPATDTRATETLELCFAAAEACRVRLTGSARFVILPLRTTH